MMKIGQVNIQQSFFEPEINGLLEDEGCLRLKFELRIDSFDFSDFSHVQIFVET